MGNLKGQLQLTNNYQLQLRSEGIWHAARESSYAVLQASFDTRREHLGSLSLELNHLEPGHASSHINLSAESFISSDSKLQLRFSNVRQREFDFAERLFENVFPRLNPVKYTSGTLNALVHLEIKNGCLAFVSADEMDAVDLLIFVKPWELAIGSERMRGSFSFDLSAPIPRETIDAFSLVDNGQLILTGINLDSWKFTNIQTHLEVEQGVLQTSSASVQLAGLKGQANILGAGSREIIQIKLTGKGQELLPFVPERIQKGIQNALQEDLLTLEAKIFRISHGIEVEGSCKVKDSHSEESVPLYFGFVIERILNSIKLTDFEDPEGWLTSLTPPLQQMITPPALLPLAFAEQHYLTQEIGYSGFKLHKGWLHTEKLSLEKFISPFLFPDGELQLSGQAALKGEFDLTGLRVFYGGSEVILENDLLAIQAPLVGSMQEPLSAFHTVDVIAKQHLGYLPLENVTYFDKSSGLLFTGVFAEAVFEGEKIHLDNVHAFCNGINFIGTVDVDYSNPLKGYYDVLVRSHTMQGSFSQAQHLLAHFEETAGFGKIPLEGFLEFGNTGAELFFGVKPEDFDFHVHVDCALTEGRMSCPHADLSAQLLNFNFLFDSRENTLDIVDLQRCLLVGKPDGYEEFAIIGKQIHFDDFAGNKAIFDIQIKEGNKDFVRFAGQLRPIHSSHPETVEVIFNPDLTHMGELFPVPFEITLTEWSRLEHLRLSGHFRLSSFIHDLQKISRSRLLFVTPDMFNYLNGFSSLGGECVLELNFDGKQGVFGFDIQGRQLVIDQYHLQNSI